MCLKRSYVIKARKLELLEQILYELNAQTKRDLVDLVYEFGSLIGEEDYLEHEIFVHMAMMVQLHQSE